MVGVADTLSTYPPIAKTHRTTAVAAVFKTVSFIFGLRNVERGNFRRDIDIPQWRPNEGPVKFF
jgi:hypothetical protein